MNKEIYSKDFLHNLINNMDNLETLSELSKNYRVGDATILEYIEYFKKIRKYFSLQKNIVELGCGNFPIMSELINNIQKSTSGSITAYDFYVNENYNGNVFLKKEYITEETNLSNFNFIFSIYPCYSSELFLQKAQEYNLDFFLAMCDCPPYYGKYEQLENLQLFDRNEIIIDYLEKDKKKILPILIRKK